MSNTPSTGQVIRQAFRFLREAYKDALAIVEATDGMLGKAGWFSTQVKRISSDLSNGPHPKKWLMQSLYRIYVDNAARKPANRALAIHIAFNPPDTYDEAVCLCIAATFPRPTDVQEMWENWEYEGSVKLLEYLRGNPNTSEVPVSLLKSLFPQASSATAFVVNLCQLTSEPVVKEIVVDPLVQQAQRAYGA